ncbi:hypothetical protein [Trichothermofontia sp.]
MSGFAGSGAWRQTRRSPKGWSSFYARLLTKVLHAAIAKVRDAG